MGPILGGVIAGLLYEYIFAANASVNKIMEFLLSSKYDTEDFPMQEQKLKILVDEENIEEVRKFLKDEENEFSAQKLHESSH